MNEEQLFQQYSTNQNLQNKYPTFQIFKDFVQSQQTKQPSGLDFLKQKFGDAKESLQNLTGGLSDLYSGIKERFGFFPSPVGLLMAGIDKLDRFDDLPISDQQFIKESMKQGKQGLGGFYRDPSSGLYKDPMGINIRSLFGNYGDYVTRQNVLRNINPVRQYTSPQSLAYNAFIQNQFARQQQLRQEQAAQAAAKAKQYTYSMQTKPSGSMQTKPSGSQGEGRVGGGGFSTQGGPYGSGPGGIHDY